MRDADLKEMREDTTAEAIEFIKYNREMLSTVKAVIKEIKGPRLQAANVKSVSEFYANEHNGNFGELFVAELDLVYWSRVVDHFKGSK